MGMLKETSRSVLLRRHTVESRVTDYQWKKYRISLLLCFVFLICYIGFGSPTRFSLFKPEVTIESPKHPCVSAIPPISRSEYTSRQNRLAQILHDLDAEAYIAEPGAHTQYFANFSTTDWKLSERPLLVIVTPHQTGKDGNIVAKVSLLTPKFEAPRAKLLALPSTPGYIEWAEEQDPYSVAVEALQLKSAPNSLNVGRKLFIDNSARHFLYDGFQHALAGTNLTVTSAPKEINQLRERKSDSEIEIMKCVNEATLLGIRHVHKQMYFGMRESEARDMISTVFADGGLSGGGCLTLFGDNAALPHGSGTNKALGQSDFALFDCTANLYGYWSDVTRTVALPSSKISSDNWNKWSMVHLAQEFAISAAKEGVTARVVDEHARFALRLAKLDEYFTHRLGHGIGLEVHEAPYLNGGSTDIIQIGHTFSNEPGVYIEGLVGVRLEDCFFINESGQAEYLTAGAGGPSKSPYEP
ncbi:hypothetical protein AGABI1DRAFT_111373 [Agaricus bisporus var. burnettii JB137-S8]|uniref:Peptidase M24 domain-containing protein n=1 Tax=Agaricus bisporus var. burnettii (strain JB137-S8 / ATCC MYA-4627 / FGSC 10392) TaxID=597362 RepID=K5W7I1_AGABU|nr:uncharacterized protein AGABI1DRAFT_111373 [Agaricus bisporus var. burnettii JB137-S8]EKM82804.1 hypothetical protein AGABI1DRAFT_111373 [Agaricus bisporus var. burnettii JB137-S8]